jgi:glycosyltransferase involved in cell wall biosynthesis
LEHLRASLFGRAISGLPKVFDSVDCISLLLERAMSSSPQIATRLIAKVDLNRTRRYEGRLGRLYDRILVTSEEDREALRALMAQRDTAHLHRKLVALPNAVDLSYFAPLDASRDSETLIFTGKMSYHANVASVLYLGREVMPIIWRDRPQVKLWLVGKDPPSAIRALAADDRVTVTGYVPDLRPYLAQATVAANPIPYSVGIQNKVLESMAMGTPVVTSPRACIALGVSPEKHLLVAHSISTFAQQVSRLLDDSELRQRVGAAGRRYVEQNHSLARIATRLVSIYQGAIEGCGQGK